MLEEHSPGMVRSMTSFRPRDLHGARRGALTLAAHGYFFVGTLRSTQPYGTIASGQSHVEYFVPEDLRQPWPIVLVHGGGGQSLDMLCTPDGRTGWLDWFLARGYAVYAMDRPGHGRAPFHPDALGAMSAPATYELMRDRFTHPELKSEWPRAAAHTQWPGGSDLDDPVLAQFMASTGPQQASFESAHANAARGGAQLLEKIGPAILVSHSAGSPCTWAIADASPGKAKAIVAVEPLGPPFLKRPANGEFTYGLTASPLHYEPPFVPGEQIPRVMNTPPQADLHPCWLQAEPARQLPRLQGFPIAVVTAEASWMALDNHGIVDYLRQAGASAVHLRLQELGICGNGHMPMNEANSDEVAAALHTWLCDQGVAIRT